jgi:hypothetical protein
MSHIDNIAELASNVFNRMVLDGLSDVLFNSRTSFKPHANVTGLSDEGLRSLLRERFQKVDKIVFNSPSFIPIEPVLYGLAKLTPDRLVADYDASFRMAWANFANDTEHDDFRQLVISPLYEMRDRQSWSRYKSLIIQDALFCNRKNVLLHIPMLWKNLKRPIVVTDSLVALPFMSIEMLFNLTLDIYVTQAPDDLSMSMEGLAKAVRFVILQYISCLGWMNGLYGHNVLPFNADRIVRNGDLELFSFDRAAGLVENYLNPEAYENIALDVRFCRESCLRKFLTVI